MTIVNPAENETRPGALSGSARPDSDFLRDDFLAGCSNLEVYRNGRWLVQNVDIAVSRGEIVTLIGPNGSLQFDTPSGPSIGEDDVS